MWKMMLHRSRPLIAFLVLVLIESFWSCSSYAVTFSMASHQTSVAQIYDHNITTAVVSNSQFFSEQPFFLTWGGGRALDVFYLFFSTLSFLHSSCDIRTQHNISGFSVVRIFLVLDALAVCFGGTVKPFSLMRLLESDRYICNTLLCADAWGIADCTLCACVLLLLDQSLDERLITRYCVVLEGAVSSHRAGMVLELFILGD